VFSRRLTGGKTPSILPSGECAQGFEILMPRLLPCPVPYSRSMEAVNCKPLNTVFVRRGETTRGTKFMPLGASFALRNRFPVGL
jgi:hypothetical protein